jgi:hypothetical protein
MRWQGVRGHGAPRSCRPGLGLAKAFAIWQISAAVHRRGRGLRRVKAGPTKRARRDGVPCRQWPCRPRLGLTSVRSHGNAGTHHGVTSTPTAIRTPTPVDGKSRVAARGVPHPGLTACRRSNLVTTRRPTDTHAAASAEMGRMPYAGRDRVARPIHRLDRGEPATRDHPPQTPSRGLRPTSAPRRRCADLLLLRQYW